MSDTPFRIAVATPLYGEPETVGLNPAYCATIYQFAGDLGVLVGEHDWAAGANYSIDPSGTFPGIISHGRNTLVVKFLRHPSNFTHCLFWDADEKAPPKTIAQLILKMVRSGHAIACVPTVQKRVDFEKLARFLRGKGENDLFSTVRGNTVERLAEILAGHASHCQTSPKVGHCEVGPVGKDDFCEVLRGFPSWGFAMVKREVFEAMIVRHRTELEYHRVEEGKITETYYDLFHCEVGEGEDVSFCNRWRKMGGKVHLYTGEGAPLDHVGRYAFKGTREAMIYDWGEHYHKGPVDR